MSTAIITALHCFTEAGARLTTRAVAARNILADLDTAHELELSVYRQALHRVDWFAFLSEDEAAVLSASDIFDELCEQQKSIDPDAIVWNSIVPPDCRIASEHARIAADLSYTRDRDEHSYRQALQAQIDRQNLSAFRGVV